MPNLGDLLREAVTSADLLEIDLAQANSDVVNLSDELATTKVELERVTADFGAYKAAHPEVEVEVPEVPQEPTPPASVNKVLIGMSAPANEWDARLRETGPVKARRLFGQLSSTSGLVTTAKNEIAAGRYPVLSFKVPNNDWSGVASGTYDAQLRTLASSLAPLPGKVFVTLHHEPAGDGTSQDFAAMQRHALPILGAPANVDAGIIANGWWWSATNQGYTDAEIAAWLPADVLALCDIVACDTYQAGDETKPGEDGGVKARRFSAWASRVNVPRLGIGEYNGFTAAAIKNAGDAILADPRYVFACVWNNTGGLGRILAGDRLTAFKATLS